MKLPLPRNPTSIAGVLFTTLGALFFLLDVLGLHSNPYMGMLFFLILPGVFIFGLLLIPLGLWRERRRRLAGKSERAWPHIDFNLPRHRNIAFLVMALTFVNVVIVSLAAYSGVHYMDSNEFCGNVCHTVMEPEFSAFQDGPHSRVGCV